jgi:hypothetical protein
MPTNHALQANRDPARLKIWARLSLTLIYELVLPTKHTANALNLVGYAYRTIERPEHRIRWETQVSQRTIVETSHRTTEARANNERKR